MRSSGAQCAQTLAVEVQQCPLRAEVGEELGEVKSWQGGSGHGSGGRVVEEKEEDEEEKKKNKKEEEEEGENNSDKI